MRLFFMFLICVVWTPSLFAQATLEGAVTKVRDGDTIEVGQIPIRFQGLTCDELDTKKGQDVRDMLKATLIGEQVVCQLNGQSSYDRLIGRCIAVDEGDIANYLIEQGYCGRCKRYDEEGLYIEAQTKAGFYEGVMPNYCR